jgi:hypothetical protein
MNHFTPRESRLFIVLFKIVAQISNPHKSVKSSLLVEYLLQASNLNLEWGRRLIFEALKISTCTRETIRDFSKRINYCRLFEFANQSNIFTMKQKFQLEIYSRFFSVAFGILCATDSFIFSRLLAMLKHEIDILPDVLPIEKIEYNAMLRNARTNFSDFKFENYISYRSQDKIDKINNKFDKILFYLGLFYFSKSDNLNFKIANSLKFNDGSLNDDQIISLRRELIIELLESLKLVYVKNWTKSSVEIIWEYSRTQMKKFIPGQQQKRLEDLNVHHKHTNDMKFRKI